MRVITGIARGQKLQTLPGEDITRPTPEVVKEAVFSALHFELEGRTMLDLFAGCGQMGIEALSRGASKVTFVDSAKQATGIITQNLQKTGFYQQSNVLCMDWKQYIKSAANRYEFDYVFLDPPYAQKLLPSILSEIYDAGLLKSTSTVICEDEKYMDENDVMITERYNIAKVSRYGRVIITYLKPKGLDE